MKRRTYLLSVGVGAAALAGCLASAESEDTPQAGYQGEEEVVYEHDYLKLRLSRDTVRIGDTIEFEVTNTGDSKITLGCHNPWAIQKYVDGEWRHVTRTSDRYYQLCATVLGPGRSLVESITVSKSELESQAEEVPMELRSG